MHATSQTSPTDSDRPFGSAVGPLEMRGHYCVNCFETVRDHIGHSKVFTIELCLQLLHSRKNLLQIFYCIKCAKILPACSGTCAF